MDINAVLQERQYNMVFTIWKFVCHSFSFLNIHLDIGRIECFMMAYLVCDEGDAFWDVLTFSYIKPKISS